MRISPVVYGFLVLAIFFGIVFGFQTAGVWSTSGKVSASGEAIQPSASDVNTIKGWMTLEQIASTYKVPLAEILAQFDLPADTPPGTAIKDLESDTFDVTALRDWLANRTQTAGEVPTVSPTPLTNLVLEPTATIQTVTTAVPTEHVVPLKTITGKTTFQELLDWGVSAETIRAIIGSDLPDPATIIKDFVTAKGGAFSDVKALLQAEVDKTK